MKDYETIDTIQNQSLLQVYYQTSSMQNKLRPHKESPCFTVVFKGRNVFCSGGSRVNNIGY